MEPQLIFPAYIICGLVVVGLVHTNIKNFLENCKLRNSLGDKVANWLLKEGK